MTTTMPDAVSQAARITDDEIVLVRATDDAVTINPRSADYTPVLTLSRDGARNLADAVDRVLAMTTPVDEKALSTLRMMSEVAGVPIDLDEVRTDADAMDASREFAKAVAAIAAARRAS